MLNDIKEILKKYKINYNIILIIMVVVILLVTKVITINVNFEKSTVAILLLLLSFLYINLLFMKYKKEQEKRYIKDNLYKIISIYDNVTNKYVINNIEVKIKYYCIYENESLKEILSTVRKINTNIKKNDNKNLKDLIEKLYISANDYINKIK